MKNYVIWYFYKAFCHQIPHQPCMHTMLSLLQPVYSVCRWLSGRHFSALHAVWAYPVLGLQMTSRKTLKFQGCSLQRACLSPPRPVQDRAGLLWQHRAQHIITAPDENFSTPQLQSRAFPFYWCSPSSFLIRCNVPLNPKVILYLPFCVNAIHNR